MFARQITVLALCASCGRIAFDAMPGDATGGDAGGDTGGDASGDGGPQTSPVAVYETVLDATPKTIAIGAVDPDSTMLLCHHRTDSASSLHQPMCELVDGTTVRIAAGGARPGCTVVVQVVRLPAGSTVRRGTFDMISGQALAFVPVGANDATRAFPLISSYQNVDLASLDERFRMTAALSGPDLVLERIGTGNTVHVAWQVVEIADSRRHSQLSVQLAGGGGVSSATLTGFDRARTFAVGTTTAPGGDEEDHLVRLELLAGADTQLRLTRRASKVSSETQTFALEVESILVEHGSHPFTTEAQAAIPLQRVVDPARAMVVVSVSGGNPGASEDLDEALVTGQIDADGTTLRLTRNANPPADVGSVVAWSVVEWQ